MADYTYFIYDGAPNTAPNFSSWGALRNDFAAQNRMGAGTGVIGAGVLYIKVRGHVTAGGNFNFVGAAGITVGSGGSCIIEPDTNPWDASATTAAGFSSSFDSVTFGGDEGITCDLNNVTVRRLMLSFQRTGDEGLTFTQPTAGMTQLVEDCVLQQTLNNAVGVLNLQGAAVARNCVINQRSTNASAWAVNLDRRHSTDPTVEQCTVISNSANSNGFRDRTGSGSTLTNVRNTYSGGATTPFGGLSAGSATGLASSTTGTPGTSAINSVAVSTTNFESVTGAGDWRSKAASVLTTTGAARLASTLLDAYGRSRSTTTTIGMFAAEVTAANPVLSGASVVSTGSTIATVRVTTDTAPSGSSTLAVRTRPAADPAWTAAEVLASPTATITSGASGARDFNLTGLVNGTALRADFAQTGPSNVVSTASFTPAASPPPPPPAGAIYHTLIGGTR